MWDDYHRETLQEHAVEEEDDEDWDDWDDEDEEGVEDYLSNAKLVDGATKSRPIFWVA